MLTGSGQLSPCASSNILSYNWSITNSSGYSLKIKSSSRDPKSFIVAPYIFPAGTSYTATLTVNSLNAQGTILSSGLVTAGFYILHGVVTAAIKGGYNRQVSLDQVLLLDASISSDEDTKTPTLFYSWSCSMGSLNNFGSSCNLNTTVAITSSSIFSLPSYRMKLSSIYNFLVVVSSSDGRKASRTASITAILPGAPVVASVNTQVKFNADRALVVPGTVTASVNVSCSWTAYTANTLITLTAALTTLSRTFLASEVKSGVSYPLLLPGSTFTPGRTYTFRLSSSPLAYPALVAHTDIVLIANSPPRGGYASVSPHTGYALNTTFSYATTGWFDDLVDYPLSYNFAYQLAALKAALIINVLSPLPYSFSPLPPGLPSLGNIVTIIANVLDIYGSASNATTFAVVTTDTRQSPAVFLNQYLSQALSSGNTNGAFQTMNLVSSTISINNCSASPNCTLLHRAHCLLTVNTCGSCLSGYKGIVGDANTLCFSSSSTHGAIGSPCTVSSNCLYNLCTNGVCAAPRKTCPSSSPDTICSGHGKCIYMDVSKNNLNSCLITDTSCTASCMCATGYGAVDCSLDAIAFAARSNTRVSICLALSQIISVSTKSAHLFDSLVSALESAYDVNEITNLAGKAECSKVLRFLGTLASRGFLAGTQASTQATFTEISSQFVGSTPAGTMLSKSSRRVLSTSSQFANDVTVAVAGITNGALKGMVAGQKAVSLVTNNVRATMTYELVSSLASANLSPPPTDADAAYGSLQPRIIVPNNGISQCSTSNYAQLSTLQFGNNPHTGSSKLQSPLLQFSSTVTSKTLKSTTSSVHSASVQVTQKSLTPAYYIVLQFSTKQHFNLSIQAGPYNHFSNVTLPKCSLYDATLSKYVGCNNCNISSYTDFNATFGCYDIKNLCPAGSTSRRLDTIDDDEKSEHEYGGYGHVYPLEDDDAYDYENVVDDQEMVIKPMIDNKEKRDNKFDKWNKNHNQMLYVRRSLSEVSSGYINGSMNATGSGDINVDPTVNTNDDYTVSTDDGPSSSDDRYSTKSQASTSEFGSILNAIGAELASVLSLNPFAIDLSKATAILAFVGSICGALLLGLYFFLRWDKLERHQYIYLLEEKLKRLKEKIVADINKGGNGVTLGKSVRRERKIENKNHNLSFLSKVNSSFTKEDIGRKGILNVFNHTLTSDSCPGKEGIDQESLPYILIAQFSNQMLPIIYSLDEGSIQNPSKDNSRHGVKLLSETLFTLQRTHYICHAFFGSSLRISRTMRYLDMCKMILLGIFIDTLIFGIYFPSDATCVELMTKTTCLAVPSKIISGATLCKWSKDTGCEIQPPPESITLTLLIAFIIILFIVPLDYCVGYVIERYASRRPVLEKWGLSTNNWLGSVYHKVGNENSPLKLALNTTKNVTEEKEEPKNRLSTSHLGILNYDQYDTEATELDGFDIGIVSDNDFIANKRYTDLLSPREELSRLMTTVQVHACDTNYQTVYYPILFISISMSLPVFFFIIFYFFSHFFIFFFFISSSQFFFIFIVFFFFFFFFFFILFIFLCFKID